MVEDQACHATAKQQNLINCLICGKLNSADKLYCQCCEGRLSERKPYSIQKTCAWLFTAILLYLPSNLLPIMKTVSFGREQSSTIVGGVISLWEQGGYVIAIVIFAASIVIPIIKILILIWLIISVKINRLNNKKERAVLYRVTEFIGRWSMIDVFVVAILVALFQLGGILRIEPGLAALAFACVVVTTMFAANAFDPRLIWDKQ